LGVRVVVLLRGVNVGSANRIAMPALREALACELLSDVRTHLQSGNTVAEMGFKAIPQLTAHVHATIAGQFGLDVPVVARTERELGDAIRRNPFTEQAEMDPKHLQVTFVDEHVDGERVARLASLARSGELVQGSGRELYSWHPHGIAGSRLALALTPKGECATARNWQTVTALLDMASRP
jgi:uncharacterized protein (DUF1697 family)